jgi:hypothetical protein
MDAAGDSAMEGDGDAAVLVSAGAWDNSVGVEHDANMKPDTTIGRRRMEFFLDWFMNK